VSESYLYCRLGLESENLSSLTWSELESSLQLSPLRKHQSQYKSIQERGDPQQLPTSPCSGPSFYYL